MNICVVGAGYWGPNLIRNFLSVEDVKSVVSCDIDLEKLKKVQQKFPMIQIESNYEKALEDKNLDAVVIATPVSTHYSLAKKALMAKKHVFLEKPMTFSSKESQELIDLAKKFNRVLMVDHIFIYTSAVVKMKELVDKNEIGDITYFDSSRINLGLFQNDVNVIWDLAPHDISILLHLTNQKPVAVFATGVDHLDNGLENIAYLTLYFENNMIAHFHLSWISPVKVRKMILGGTKKMVVYDDMESDEKIKVYDKGIDLREDSNKEETLVQYRVGDIFIPTLKNSEALGIASNHFIDCIKTGKTPITNALDGLWVVKILEAAQKSIKLETKVNL